MILSRGEFSAGLALEVLRIMEPYLPYALVVSGFDGEILYYNQQFVELFGCKPYAKQRVKDFYEGKLFIAAQPIDMPSMENHNSELNYCMVGKSDGSREEVCFVVLKLPDGVQGSTDITLFGNIEQFRRGTDRAEVQSTVLKTDFLSNVSHEIRTPMNAIMGMAEMLATTNLNKRQRKFLEVLIKGGRSLMNLINDILVLSQLENGRLLVESAPFDLHGFVRDVIDMVEPLAGGKAIDIRDQLAPEVPRMVAGDKKRLEQVLLNLLGNAIKFTEKGQILLVVKPDTKGQIVFSVQDTGRGIPRDQFERIFQRFTQLQSSLNNSNAGLGLGLAISKRLVEWMGGRIWVESKVGDGSTFHFSVHLPDASGAEEYCERRPKANDYSGFEVLDGMTVLVVEDSADNAFLISMFLKDVGCKLEFAANGREAIEKYKVIEPDIILMDVQMPEVDGYTATRRIRKLEQSTGNYTPILALTAFAQSSEVQKSLDVGCDDHLSKPISKFELLNTMIELVTMAKKKSDAFLECITSKSAERQRGEA